MTNRIGPKIVVFAPRHCARCPCHGRKPHGQGQDQDLAYPTSVGTIANLLAIYLPTQLSTLCATTLGTGAHKTLAQSVDFNIAL